MLLLICDAVESHKNIRRWTNQIDALNDIPRSENNGRISDSVSGQSRLTLFRSLVIKKYKNNITGCLYKKKVEYFRLIISLIEIFSLTY